ncbi:hypothetical protein AgCh_037339 [Apium graveolens]
MNKTFSSLINQRSSTDTSISSQIFNSDQQGNGFQQKFDQYRSDTIINLERQISTSRYRITAKRVQLTEVVSTMQKGLAKGTAGEYVISNYVGLEKDYDNDYVGDSLLNDNEKTIEKSNFSEAMATRFNPKNVISQDNKAAQNAYDFSEELQKSETGMCLRRYGRVTLETTTRRSQKTSDFSDKIQKNTDEKITERIQKIEPEDNNATARRRLVFSELNDNLKDQFKKYLEIRGIKPSTTNAIFGYMLDKVNRENLRSLYKFRELLQ